MRFHLHAGAASILEDYNWGAYGRFVDVGGAYGSFLADLLHRHPGASAALFDQAQVHPWCMLLCLVACLLVCAVPEVE
jgi:hypothetical protein